MWILSIVLASSRAFDAYNFEEVSTFFCNICTTLLYTAPEAEKLNRSRWLNVNIGPLFAVTKETVSMYKKLAALSSVQHVRPSMDQQK